MRAYEMMIILDPSVEERSVGSSMEKILKQVTAAGGTVDNIDVWGKRSLAYQINKLDEGIYVVVNVHTTPEIIQEIDRQLSLNESVLRTKVLRTEHEG
ncbi:30S ribosomal protein S6 [Actinomyces minihominis]|uniref:30S ribosomal protein S6 n=1 Tax=Actinomyces minihominis TaxID=2002838 RepID=UPI000C068D0C|nr:30S ribosomal protein S6 [Actinomyces minihominis]